MNNNGYTIIFYHKDQRHLRSKNKNDRKTLQAKTISSSYNNHPKPICDQ